MISCFETHVFHVHEWLQWFQIGFLFFDSWLASCAGHVHKDSARTSVDFSAILHLERFPNQLRVLSIYHNPAQWAHVTHQTWILDFGWLLDSINFSFPSGDTGRTFSQTGEIANQDCSAIFCLSENRVSEDALLEQHFLYWNVHFGVSLGHTQSSCPCEGTMKMIALTKNSASTMKATKTPWFFWKRSGSGSY